jgi:hypothetical protein
VLCVMSFFCLIPYSIDPKIIHPHPAPLPKEERDHSPSSTSSSHQGRRTEEWVFIGRGRPRYLMGVDRKRVHVTITGMVQGVFFRAKTRNEAIRNNVAGWVRNLPDGSVEARRQIRRRGPCRRLVPHRSQPGRSGACRNIRGIIHGRIYGLQYPIRALRNGTASGHRINENRQNQTIRRGAG